MADTPMFAAKHAAWASKGHNLDKVMEIASFFGKSNSKTLGLSRVHCQDHIHPLHDPQESQQGFRYFSHLANLVETIGLELHCSFSGSVACQGFAGFVLANRAPRSNQS